MCLGPRKKKDGQLVKNKDAQVLSLFLPKPIKSVQKHK